MIETRIPVQKIYRVVAWKKTDLSRVIMATKFIAANSGQEAIATLAGDLGLSRERWDGSASPEVVLRIEEILSQK
jgi:hypothetical protein